LQAAEAKGPDGKRCRVGGSDSPVKPKVEEVAASDASVELKAQKKGKGKTAKPAVEPPKDYVHVRARRGQATDSHSLAERVRHCDSTCFLPFELICKMEFCALGLSSQSRFVIGVLIG
jgi:hypothetical protein